MRSSVYRNPGAKSGGCVGRVGRSARGSDGMRRTIRNFSGRVVATGLIRLATFLYASVSAAGKKFNSSAVVLICPL